MDGSRLSSTGKSLFRGGALIVAATAFGQVLAAVAAPLLTRFYSPTEFGLFSVASSFLITMGVIGAGRFELAIPLVSSDEDGRALLILAALSAVVTCAVMTVVMAVFASSLGEVLNEKLLVPWIPWLPLLATLLCAFSILNQWNLRRQRYEATAARNVVQSSTTVGYQCVAGAAGAGASGLILGMAFGQGLGAAVLARGAGLRGPFPSRTTLSRLARRFRRFPLLLAPSGLLNSLGLYLPVVLMAALYGSSPAGWLGLTQRILGLPIALIGQSAAQVYSSELARRRRDAIGGERQLFWNASALLASIGALGAVVLVVFGRQLFRVVFGEVWAPSGEMAQALGVAMACQLVATALSQTLIVYEKTTTQIAWDAFRVAVVLLAITTAKSAGLSAVDCIWVYAGASTIAYVVAWELSRRALRAAATHPGSSPETRAAEL
jgi:O-antigen/teichoic acid export membrane protein